MYLGIDCGTQGTKALLTNSNGRALGRGYAPHRLIASVSGAREQEPAWWVAALKTAVQQAVAEAGRTDVVALAVSGQQHGLVVLDAERNVIRAAKLWNDTSTASQNSALIERLGGPAIWAERLGIVPLTGYTVSKLLWLKEHESANFMRIGHILLPHEYLNLWLTGQMRAEAGDASGTGYFDVRQRQWNPEVLAAIDGGTGQLYNALPPIIGVQDPAGTLRPEAAAKLGLPPGALVAAGGGDNMMGAIGTGNVREGIVTVSLGTSATVYTFRSAPPTSLNPAVAPFCSSTDGFLPLVCTMNATDAVGATLNLLGRTVREIEPALAGTPPGADGLVFLPYLNGERTPDLPEARGSLHGLSPLNFTPEHLIRAAVEGVSFGLIDGLRLIAPRVERLRLIGGGSRSGAWRQMLADSTGAEVEVPAEEEAGCLGAAIQSMYLHLHLTGRSESFVELTSRCVTLDEARSAQPNVALEASYAVARERFLACRRRLYGV